MADPSHVFKGQTYVSRLNDKNMQQRREACDMHHQTQVPASIGSCPEGLRMPTGAMLDGMDQSIKGQNSPTVVPPANALGIYVRDLGTCVPR